MACRSTISPSSVSRSAALATYHLHLPPTATHHALPPPTTCTCHPPPPTNSPTTTLSPHVQVTQHLQTSFKNLSEMSMGDLSYNARMPRGYSTSKGAPPAPPSVPPASLAPPSAPSARASRPCTALCTFHAALRARLPTAHSCPHALVPRGQPRGVHNQVLRSSARRAAERDWHPEARLQRHQVGLPRRPRARRTCASANFVRILREAISQPSTIKTVRLRPSGPSGPWAPPVHVCPPPPPTQCPNVCRPCAAQRP